MGSLRDIVVNAMKGYAVDGLNGHSYFTHNDVDNVYKVVFISRVRGEIEVDTGLVVRLLDDVIYIDYDSNNKPLVDALLQAGVPLEKIVLAYAGETIETA